MPSLACPQCRRALGLEDPFHSVRPWCPHCGADLKAGQKAARPAPPPPAPAVATTDIREGEPPPPVVLPAPTPAMTVAHRPPRYIEGRTSFWSKAGRRVYRLYATEKDLLVLNLGPLVPPPNPAVVVGAVLGGALGALAASAFVGENRRRSPAVERGKQLDRADELGLRVHAEEGGGSFPLSAEEVDHIHLDPPSLWGRLLGRHAVLTLRLRSGYRLTLRLLRFTDVWRAAEDLPRLFGTAVAVNVPWASGRRTPLAAE